MKIKVLVILLSVNGRSKPEVNFKFYKTAFSSILAHLEWIPLHKLNFKNENILYLLLLIPFVLSNSDGEKSKVDCSNRITNESLIAIIKDYVKRGDGTTLDHGIPYLSLQLIVKPWSDTSNYFILRYAVNEDLIYSHQYPVIICSPIAGKKIIFQTTILSNFVNGDIDGAASFYKSEYPQLYKINEKNRQFLKDELKKGVIVESSVTCSFRQLEILFDRNGKFIDSTYYNRL